VQSYPNDYIPHNNLAVNYSLMGRYEESLQEGREAVRLSPTAMTALGNVVEAYMRLNRFDEAHQVLEQTLGQNPDRGIYRFNSYNLAFLRGDQETMKRDLDWWASHSKDTDFFDLQAGTAAFNGQWHKSLDFTRRSTEIKINEDRKENAAQNEANIAFYESAFGRCQQAKEAAGRSLSLSRGRIGLSVVALALAVCNDSQAQSLADELLKRFPKDTASIGVMLPMTRAAIELSRGNTAPAINLLRPASRFELGGVAGFWVNYLRGQTYLKQRSGKEAAAEFQKIIDHRGVEPASPIYPLAHLGLARAAALNGDTAQARKSYQDFLALWKDADSDLPVLQQAKDEYEKLK
jgi:tetratricopeptide (TPR) repeat protein